MEDIQRLLKNLQRQLGPDAPGKGRQAKGQGKGVKGGENWDCPHCADVTALTTLPVAHDVSKHQERGA